MAGPYRLAREEYPGSMAGPFPGILREIRDWLNHIESAFAWYVDRWQR